MKDVILSHRFFSLLTFPVWPQSESSQMMKFSNFSQNISMSSIPEMQSVPKTDAGMFEGFGFVFWMHFRVVWRLTSWTSSFSHRKERCCRFILSNCTGMKACSLSISLSDKMSYEKGFGHTFAKRNITVLFEKFSFRHAERVYWTCIKALPSFILIQSNECNVYSVTNLPWIL